MSGCLRVRVIVGVLVLASMLACPTSAQPPATPEQLAELFDQNASAGYETALVLFDEAARRGDVQGMMAVLRVPMSLMAQVTADGQLELDSNLYGRPLDDMAEAVARAAEAAGRWELVGKARASQALIAAVWGMTMYPFPAFLRANGYIRAADEAFARAGLQDDPHLEALRRQLSSRGQTDDALSSDWDRRAAQLGDLGPLATAMMEAAAEHRDAEAVALHRELVERLASQESEQVYAWGGTYAAMTLAIPGTEATIPALRRLVDKRGDTTLLGSWPLLSHSIGSACWMLWFGRNDIFRDTGYWARRHYKHGQAWVPGVIGQFAGKLARYGREAEALAMAEHYIQTLLDAPPYARYVSRWLPRMLWPGAPAHLRRAAVGLMCEDCELGTGAAVGRGDVGAQNQARYFPGQFADACQAFRSRFGAAPRAWATDPGWAIETGSDLVTLAQRMEKPEDCIAVLEEAAKFFELTDRPELVAETMALAQAVAAANPEALHRLVLSRAQWEASQGRWGEVIGLLTSGFADQPATAEFLQACVLLVQAHLHQAQIDEANRAFQRAVDLAASVGLSPGECANYYVGLARMTPDAQWRRKLLEQARGVLVGAGLDMMANAVDQEFAALALDAGNLADARQALIDVIDRAERQRQQLAFDPLLRQRWFADNITPYRQLVRVAALQQDAELALACGERMRGRALLDQLAWKKVDMAVELSPAHRQRFADLRALRAEAYALLDRVTGGGSQASALRGAYMPVRGVYLPIRGTPGATGPATAGEVQYLTELLERLAAEEAALEGAIREQVPAYERAASQSIPTGAEIAAAAARHEGLAVLEYTFADQGLVVVALSGGQKQVHLIACDRDALYEQIGRFREAIWERTDDAHAQARALYATLVAPVEGALAGARRLWIVADGALQLVPFAALQDGSGRYLGQRLPIAFAPSLTLALSSRGERPTPSRSAVIVAAPETGATQLAQAPGEDERGYYMPIRGMYLPVRGYYMPMRGEGEVSSALTAMAMVLLPEAEAEGEAIAGRFLDAVLLTGAQATKSALVQVGGDCGVLHIATHGYADPDFPDFSGLLLAAPEGAQAPYQVLTAGEVYGWPLNARLVTLSACQTALGRDVQGEGILGLSRAFIYAGAQDVVCSLWPVSDESTRALMVAFYDALAAGAPVEEALQAGQNALPHTGDRGHPFYWAGFIAVRGPG